MTIDSLLPIPELLSAKRILCTQPASADLGFRILLLWLYQLPGKYLSNIKQAF